jgi:hypothetical protein
MEIDVKQEDYYTCERCDITSLTEGRMCPCPRGSCEAKISGTINITTTLDKNLTSEQEQWNEENYRN